MNKDIKWCHYHFTNTRHNAPLVVQLHGFLEEEEVEEFNVVRTTWRTLEIMYRKGKK